MSARLDQDGRAQRWLVQRTPENVEIRFLLADPGSRIFAFWVDLFIQGVVVVGIMTVFQLSLGALGAALGLVWAF
ncbi:MAG: hypothetical protein AAF602_28520, partial [Myxococcota bacterium]